jgi:hypothetical protein
MKRVLLIGIILAILILAMPQGVLAVGPNAPLPVVVNAQYGATSATTFDAVLHTVSGVWTWDLVTPSASDNLKSPAIDFTVNSLAIWDVTAYDSYATPAGRQKGFLHGDLGDLQNPVQMTSGGGVTWNTLTTYTSGSPLTVYSGASKTSAQTWSENLKQPVTATDLASHSGYHTQITYTCVASF